MCLILGFIHVQTSRHGQKIDGIEDSENTLVSNLKKSNPNKFLRYIVQHSDDTVLFWEYAP